MNSTTKIQVLANLKNKTTQTLLIHDFFFVTKLQKYFRASVHYLGFYEYIKLKMLNYNYKLT